MKTFVETLFVLDIRIYIFLYGFGKRISNWVVGIIESKELYDDRYTKNCTKWLNFQISIIDFKEKRIIYCSSQSLFFFVTILLKLTIVTSWYNYTMIYVNQIFRSIRFLHSTDRFWKLKQINEREWETQKIN